MGADRNFFYNFDAEYKLENWEIRYSDDNKVILRCQVTGLTGNYVFLAPCLNDSVRTLQLEKLYVNDQLCIPNKAGAMYVHTDFARYGIPISLDRDVNELTAEISIENGNQFTHQKLNFTLIEAEHTPEPINTQRKIHSAVTTTYQRNVTQINTTGWHIGAGGNTPGRFGFSKGDGLLDCAMPALGVVDKMFLCGQPDYRKPYRWSYSVRPEGMPLHGSFEPRDTGIEQDEIQVTHLSVRWATKHNGKNFSCRYSLASPAILTEYEEGTMHISGLQFAGNYQSVLIPRTDGIEEVAIDEANIQGMSENWILLFHSTEFPDVPLMLVFDRNPESMTVSRNTGGRLSAITFEGCPLMLSCTPFGIERFHRGQMQVEEAIRRCRFWSRALLAYPVKQWDYFKLDEPSETVRILQKFEYRYISDAWNTEPLELAPLPPPLSICKTAHCPDSIDFSFPTKYGWLRGKIGTWSEYELPYMPLERKFPLKHENSNIPDLLQQGMVPYKKLVSTFGPDKVSYPYAGAILEPFAFASTMSLFMNEEDQKFMHDNLAKRLPIALQEDGRSDYTVIDWGEIMTQQPEHDAVIDIYQDPNKKHIHLFNWYTRREPFTGVTFKICYLNVYFFSTGVIQTATPEEILELTVPLIENDWGVGLTFYYLYLSALATGSFEEIRKNWSLLKDVYAFFERMHDWACMGTGYSDNGITWVEGANYGLFPAYIHMAEAAGDAEARAFGIYNAAKQMALRLAIMHSSLEYFPQYFEVEPWYCTKHFHEEFCPNMAFQNVPKLPQHRCRKEAIYNFTTEGLFPETYLGMGKLGGSEYKEIMNKLEDELLHNTPNIDEIRSPSTVWHVLQSFSGLLIHKALDTDCTTEDFYRILEEGKKKGFLMRQWRGIHIFSRVLPENYFLCQLLAWIEMRNHKLWLEHWEETKIQRALWTSDTAEITFRSSGHGSMKLQCGVTETPKQVLLNGTEIPFQTDNKGHITLTPDTDGILTIHFRSIM